MPDPPTIPPGHPGYAGTEATTGTDETAGQADAEPRHSDPGDPCTHPWCVAVAEANATATPEERESAQRFGVSVHVLRQIHADALPAADADAAEHLAQLFHETYERLAPSHGYETRKASAKPWSEVPEPNRGLMVAVAGHVLATWTGWPAADADRAGEDDALDLDAIRQALAEAQAGWSEVAPQLDELGGDEARELLRAFGDMTVKAAGVIERYATRLAEMTRRYQEALAAFETAGFRAELAEAERDDLRTRLGAAEEANAELGTALTEARAKLARSVEEAQEIATELAEARTELQAKVDGGEWVIDYGHDPGRPTVHGIEWHPGLHCVRDTYQRRVWRGPVEPVTDETEAGRA